MDFYLILALGPRNGLGYCVVNRHKVKGETIVIVKQLLANSRYMLNVECAKTKNETVSHIASGWSKLAQKEYKKRHDNVARAIHLDLSEKYGFDRNDKWYNHVPESVLENENYKLLWDFSIRTDHYIEARRPDLVLVDKSKKSCHIIDVAIQKTVE